MPRKIFGWLKCVACPRLSSISMAGATPLPGKNLRMGFIMPSWTALDTQPVLYLTYIGPFPYLPGGLCMSAATVFNTRDFKVITLIGVSHYLSHVYHLVLPTMFPLIHKTEGDSGGFRCMLQLFASGILDRAVADIAQVDGALNNLRNILALDRIPLAGEDWYALGRNARSATFVIQGLRRVIIAGIERLQVIRVLR